MDPGGEGLGYDRLEDLIREELAREGCTAPKQHCGGEEADSNSISLPNSPMIAAMPLGGRQGTIIGVPRERGGRRPCMIVIIG